MRLLTTATYRTVPWKNGGGTTTEIFVSPEGLGVGDRFLYRLSVASVASSGPFSAFTGYDRHLAVVEGEGMTLALPGRTLALRPFEPVAFSGDDPAEGTLVAGPVRDLNLIVDRARARGSLACEVLTGPTRIACASGDVCMVHVLDGELDVAGPGETLVLEASRDVAPRRASRVAVARVSLS